MDTQNTPPTNKRKCPPSRRPVDISSSSSSDDDSAIVPPHAAAAARPPVWPRFLLVKATDPECPLSKLSPFAIAKTIKGLAGEPKQVTRLRSGDILVEVVRKSHSDNLLRSTLFAGIPVKIESHSTLNSSKGIIRSRDLLKVSEEELLTGLKDEGVVGVKRFTYRKDGKVLNSTAILLTFSSPTLPEKIIAGYLRLDVSPFIPSPLRCFKCQAFGHHRDRCPRNARCGRCGAEHEEDSCSSPPSCVNCSGSHPSFSRDCPQWQREREIQRVRVTQRVSFPEARRVVESSTITPSGGSFAEKVKANLTATVACQTFLSCFQKTFSPESVSSTAVQTAFEEGSEAPPTSDGESAPPTSGGGSAPTSESLPPSKPVQPSKPAPPPKQHPPPPPSTSSGKKPSNRFKVLQQQEEDMEVTPPPRPHVKKK